VFRISRSLGFAFLIGFALLVTGCAGGIPGLAPTPIDTVAPTETPQPTETPTPTATALPPVGLLLLPDGADPNLADQLQSFLAERIPAQGMRFQVRSTLRATDFDRDEVRWVIALAPYADLGAMVAIAPQTRFLAVGFNNLEPAANLTVVTRPEDWYVQQAFMACYLGMVITPDWRSGMIRVNTPEGALAAEAFYNGSLFFCSSPSGNLACYARYAPVYGYPIIAYGEPETTADEWPGVGRYMLGQYVETIFVSPEVKSEQLLRYLAQEEVEIIGTGATPSDLSARWVASLEYDIFQEFQDYWPEFVAGAEGQLVEVPLVITHVNPELLSPGRQQFVEQMLADVQAGYIVMVDEEENVNNP
jgi:hypothetical protein